MIDHEATFVSGEGLLGRVIGADGAPLDDAGPLQNVHHLALPTPAAPASGAFWETGIKVIDCFAPLARGGTVALHASPGVGMLVTIAELLQRVVARGGCAVMAELEDAGYPLREKLNGLRETGVLHAVAKLAGPADASADERAQLVRAALGAAEGFASAGRELLLVIDDSLLDEQSAELLRGRARYAASGSLTLVFCLWRHETPLLKLDPAPRALVEAADSRLNFSRELAQQQIWPAIDPRASRSRLLDDGRVAYEHRAVAERARALLDKLNDSTASEAARARRVLRFGGQPFVVAEPFTARPGAVVPLAETLRGYDGLASGAFDGLDDTAISFTGALPS
jgi:F-type H+-transporting ATPase subunit beta